jgi:hypothetical protein
MLHYTCHFSLLSKSVSHSKRLHRLPTVLHPSSHCSRSILIQRIRQLPWFIIMVLFFLKTAWRVLTSCPSIIRQGSWQVNSTQSSCVQYCTNKTEPWAASYVKYSTVQSYLVQYLWHVMWCDDWWYCVWHSCTSVLRPSRSVTRQYILVTRCDMYVWLWGVPKKGERNSRDYDLREKRAYVAGMPASAGRCTTRLACCFVTVRVLLVSCCLAGWRAYRWCGCLSLQHQKDQLLAD